MSPIARTKIRLGVLVSGNGTNLQALLDACADPDFPAEVALVVSNVREAFAVERARRSKVDVEVLEHRHFPTRDAFDEQLVRVLQKSQADTICLAGFMRLLGSRFLKTFSGRVLNIHPSLLPAFPGIHGVRDALEYGVKISGCSVHFVDEGLDSGPVIAQAAVPVWLDDTEATLAARILEYEHTLYPLAVRWLAEGRLSVRGRHVELKGQSAGEIAALLNPGLDRG